jgi:hypothetical protein
MAYQVKIPWTMLSYQSMVVWVSWLAITVIWILAAVTLGLYGSTLSTNVWNLIVASLVISLLAWLFLLIGGSVITKRTKQFLLRVRNIQTDVNGSKVVKTVSINDVQRSLGFY